MIVNALFGMRRGKFVTMRNPHFYSFESLVYLFMEILSLEVAEYFRETTMATV